MSPKEYVDQSRQYWSHGEECLRKGDLLQASEKFWGAAAEMVKAVAEKKGWYHNGHRQLWKVMHKLAEELGDLTLRKSFGMASQLHINFYENDLDKVDIELFKEEIRKGILDRLTPLLEDLP